MRRSSLFVVLLGLALVVGCVQQQSPTAPVAPVESPTLPLADESQPSKRGLPSIEAVPPALGGWRVVSGSSTQLVGPIWDQDWRVTFYLPNRSSLPATRMFAAKNIFGTWLNYNAYAQVYSHGPSGSYYRVTYLFGGNRATVFGINMFDATNLALYYQ